MSNEEKRKKDFEKWWSDESESGNLNDAPTWDEEEAYIAGRQHSEKEIEKRDKLLDRASVLINMGDSEFHMALNEVRKWISDYTNMRKTKNIKTEV